MNIIELAKEAGFELGTAWYGNSKVLERFAALVRAEREWVDLTDNELIDALGFGKLLPVSGVRGELVDARAVIAAFKEKNK